MSGKNSKILRRFCAAQATSKPYRWVKRMYNQLNVNQKARFRRFCRIEGYE